MILGIVGKGIKEYSYVIVFVLLVLVVLFTMSSVFTNEIEADIRAIIVEEGDTLWGIAKKYHQETGVSIQEYIDHVRNLNQLDSVLIHPGQELEVFVAQYHTEAVVTFGSE